MLTRYIKRGIFTIFESSYANQSEGYARQEGSDRF